MIRRIFFLSIVLMTVSSSVIAADAIKIGLIAPMTGAWSNIGEEIKLVVGLIAEDFNSKGGALGKKIEIVAVNDEGTPQGAIQAAKELVGQAVTAVIGSLTSSATEASQDIFNQAKIIQVTNASSAVGLTEKQLKYFFRTCPRDDEQSRVVIQTVQKMKHSKLAILYDSTASYAIGLAQEVREHAQQKKIDVVSYESLLPGQKNYLDILKKIKTTDPDSVFFAGYYMEAANLLRQKKELDWHAIFIGSDGVNNRNLVSIAGKEAAEGFYFTSPPLPGELTSEYARSFLAEFKKKTGTPAQAFDSILAGDALRVIINAIRETKSSDPDVMADYLHSRFVDDFGLTGRISFNAKGDRLNDLYGIYRVDAQGVFVVQRMFQFGQIVK